MIIENEEATSTRKRLVSGRYETRSTIIENEGAMSIEKRFVSGRYETRSTIIEATPKEF
jgi:hypothetical protein